MMNNQWLMKVVNHTKKETARVKKMRRKRIMKRGLRPRRAFRD